MSWRLLEVETEVGLLDSWAGGSEGLITELTEL